MKTLIVGGLGTLALVLLASQAEGAYVNYDVNVGSYLNFGMDIYRQNGGALVKHDSGMVGEITLRNKTGDGNHLLPATYSTVCVDLLGTLYVPRNYGFTAPVQFGLNAGWAPEWGYDGTDPDSFLGIQRAADLYYTHKIQGYDWVNDSTHWAALQLAVWDALYDTHVGNAASAYNTATGRFQVTSGDSGAISLANTWLHDINPNGRYAGALIQPDPAIQYGATGQELFMNVTPVPEPTTLIAGALLLLPFGASTLRVLRRNRSA
jgi:hypothetical protein